MPTTKESLPVELVKKIVNAQNRNLIETLEELADKEYLAQVAEARADYRAGRTISLEELKTIVSKKKSGKKI